MSVATYVAIAVLAGIGAPLRFLVGGAVSSRLGADLPWGTFVVNVSGAAVLGLIAGLSLSDDAALLAGTAAVGSYTTFSTWMSESHRLGEDGRGGALAANLVGSVVLGVGAVALGRLVAGRL